MKICLNMIVKNEAAIIERCLAAVAPYISCYVIADTGSTDGTQEKIASFFEARDITGKIVDVPFVDFSQARNAALLAAECSDFAFDYLLFTDADMEFVVKDIYFADNLTKPGYNIPQKAGSLYYQNIRLAKRGCGARYFGPTHEYLDISNAPVLNGVEFIDHACGSNRPEKFERDERLLKAALEADPDNARYTFYLAQTYFHGGKIKDAIPLYAKRAKMGGFEEEGWFAALAEALCERDLGNEDAFLTKALAAWQRRPQRAEPLYYLAAHAMRTGKHALVCLFCEEGMRIPFPKDDRLFIEAWIYDCGFSWLFSVSGFYDKGRRERASALNNALMLTRRFPDAIKATAAANVVHYLAPLSTFLPSWQARQIDFTPPDGWNATNPSISTDGELIECVVRTVNYEIDFRPEGAFYVTPDRAPIQTRNWLIRLTVNLETIEAAEIERPADMPEPVYKQIIGFEDLRLIHADGERWVSGTLCETTPDGHRNMTIARIDGNRLSDWRIVEPETPKQHEKNWMPFTGAGEIAYLYSCDPIRVVNADGKIFHEAPAPIVASRFRGGSQVIPFEDGSLCIIHEVHTAPKSPARTYYHRFVFFDADMQMKKVSPPFVFNAVRVEFCAGLAWVGNRLALSYGVDDCEAWIGTVDANEVSEFLIDVHYFV